MRISGIRERQPIAALRSLPNKVILHLTLAEASLSDCQVIRHPGREKYSQWQADRS